MAEFRQGYLDNYSQNSTGVGIGTSSASDAKLEIVGGTTTQELNVTGIASFTSVSGFIEKHTTYTENVNINAGDSATLSGEIIVGAGLTMSVGTSVTASQGSIDSLKVSNMFQPPSGTTNTRPAGKPGSLFYNFDFKTIEFFDGNSWRQVDNVTRSGRALLAGATSDGELIHSINISSEGNSIDFGFLQTGKSEMNGMSDGTRGIFANGYDSPARINVIEYVTIASEGNSIDFGDSTQLRNSGDSGCSSSTRGVMGGGYSAGNSPNQQNVIDYIEIQTIGNALDFGDLVHNDRYGHGACSSSTRGLFGGGRSSPAGAHKDITSITIASKGNSVQFGTLTQKRSYLGSSGNSIRGMWSGGYDSGSGDGKTTIDYVTIASEGNAIDFGDRTKGQSYGCATASQTRFVMFGSRVSPNVAENVIDFVTIATTGNATDFGDISWSPSVGYHAIGALSDSHGGLGGF